MSWWNKVEYNAKRAGYATLEGTKAVINSYDPRNWTSTEAAQQTALKRTKQYSDMANDLIKAGAKVGPGFKILSKFSLPLAGISLYWDAKTFKIGFSRGWQAYGLN